MLDEIELLSLELRQPGFQQLVRIEFCPYRHVSHARPDQYLNAVDLFRPARKGCTEYHVASIGVVTEEQGPGSLQEGAEGCPGRLSQRSKPVRSLSREARRHLGRLQRAFCLCRDRV